MSDHVYKSHNKTLLLYHFVFPAKYRRHIFTKNVSDSLKAICLELSERYEVHFVEIGMEEDHVHFLVQSIPMFSVTKLESVHTMASIIMANRINPENMTSNLS